MITSSYKVHDILTFKIVDNRSRLGRLLGDVDKQYEAFKSMDANDYDLTIYLGDFAPSKRDCFILDDRYHVGQDYFYCERNSYKLAKWRFEMLGFESGTIIARIHSNLVGNMFISGNVIDFLIHFGINERDCSLIHASGVSKDRHAFLFAGLGGAGKTVIALHLAKRGFDFLGDNFVILQKGNVLAFPSPLNIFTYNLAPVVRNKLGLRGIFLLFLKNLLYKVTQGYIKIFTKISVKKLFPRQKTDVSKLKALFILMPRDSLRIQEISEEEAVRSLFANQQLDIPLHNRYIMQYLYAFPRSHLSGHWRKYMKNLRENLGTNTSFYRVEVPRIYEEKTLEKISEVVEYVRKRTV